MNARIPFQSESGRCSFIRQGPRLRSQGWTLEKTLCIAASPGGYKICPQSNHLLTFRAVSFQYSESTFGSEVDLTYSRRSKFHERIRS